MPLVIKDLDKVHCYIRRARDEVSAIYHDDLFLADCCVLQAGYAVIDKDQSLAAHYLTNALSIVERISPENKIATYSNIPQAD